MRNLDRKLATDLAAIRRQAKALRAQIDGGDGASRPRDRGADAAETLSSLAYGSFARTSRGWSGARANRPTQSGNSAAV